MAIVKVCDRCGAQLKPPALTGTAEGDPATEIELRIQPKPWNGVQSPPEVHKVGDYCPACTDEARAFFAQFSVAPAGPLYPPAPPPEPVP